MELGIPVSHRCGRLRLYLAESVTRTAAIIVCPGGAYGGLAEHEGEPIALWLNTLGISAFVLHYRVSPSRHPDALLDAQKAIRTVRNHAEEWNIDPERVGIMGFSAGGHLASMTATAFDDGIQVDESVAERMSSRPDLLIACYPVISFGEYRNDPSMTNLLGDDPEMSLRRQLSSELQVTPRTPPTFMWHTADDRAVPVENSLLFAQALSQCNVPFELHVYERGPHGMGLANDDEYVGAWKTACAAWLKKRFFIPEGLKE